MRARDSSQCAVIPYLHYSVLAAAGATTPSLTTAKVGRRDSVRTDDGKPRRSESGQQPTAPGEPVAPDSKDDQCQSPSHRLPQRLRPRVRVLTRTRI